MYYLVYGVAFLLVLLLCWTVALTGFVVKPLPIKDYSVRRCELTPASGGPVLRILDVVYMGELDVMDTWCQSAEMAKHFSAVEARSVHRDHFDRRALYESRYDLVLAKPELIGNAAQVGNTGIAYEMIAGYPGYGSQLVSLQGKPQLTAQWLQGKQLGLLDDPNSVSAYQIPMSALREGGLLDVPDIVFFRSYRELIRALLSGDVDVIAIILSKEGPDSQLSLPEGLVLAQDIPGPGWFAHPALLQSAGYCTLLDALDQFASSTGVDYFREQKILRPCTDD